MDNARRENLQRLLKHFGSQRKVANMLSISQSQISSILSGAREMGADVARRIEQAMNMPPYSFDDPIAEFNAPSSVTTDYEQVIIDAAWAKGWEAVTAFKHRTPLGSVQPDITLQRGDAELLCFEIVYDIKAEASQNSIDKILAMSIKYEMARLKPTVVVIVGTPADGLPFLRWDAALSYLHSHHKISDYVITNDPREITAMIT